MESLLFFGICSVFILIFYFFILIFLLDLSYGLKKLRSLYQLIVIVICSIGLLTSIGFLMIVAENQAYREYFQDTKKIEELRVIKLKNDDFNYRNLKIGLNKQKWSALL